jgi:HAE1 family hydrophobic/amphiphilic exporter-1
VGTFLFMTLAGRNINVVSLAGLSFAVGMVVDNSIVVFENIFPPPRDGENPYPGGL